MTGEHTLLQPQQVRVHSREQKALKSERQRVYETATHEQTAFVVGVHAGNRKARKIALRADRNAQVKL